MPSGKSIFNIPDTFSVSEHNQLVFGLRKVFNSFVVQRTIEALR
jgi:hypothetical protein